MGMPHISGKLRQQLLNISSLTIPCRQSVDSEGMSEIMYPWLLLDIPPRDTQSASNSPENAFYGFIF